MYGGELALRQFLEDLAWIDQRDEGVPGVLEPRGAWSPLGVSGVFARMFGGSPRGHEDAAAFVYADLAGMWGYLEPRRKLTGQEYSRLRSGARQWTAAADRTSADVLAAFGEPSLWRPKYNPWYPMSLGYVSGCPMASKILQCTSLNCEEESVLSTLGRHDVRFAGF
jgi:hypothetical protein